MVFTVAPPPSDLKVYQSGPTKIKLTWNLPSHPSVTTGYRIVYSVAGGSSNSVEVDGGSNSYILTGLLNGANYEGILHYKVPALLPYSKVFRTHG